MDNAQIASSLARPEDRLQVVYRHLTYSVKLRKKELPKKRKERKKWHEDGRDCKNVLEDIDGFFQPGRLTAIIGSSGAGKTSLLSVIAGETTSGTVTGSIIVNGEDWAERNMREISGFVFQDDILLETMTVREAIHMSALLRLPKTVSKEERHCRIDDVINMLHLNKAMDTEIGSAGGQKGISGGERKRVSIAMEVVTNPGMIFLDEPTSGLDTYTAFHVMKMLKLIAHRQGRTVVATIHQPSSEIYHLFDDLLILAQGKVVFHGTATRAIEYFAERGFPCPNFTNPSDYFFMKVLKDVDDFDVNDVEQGTQHHHHQHHQGHNHHQQQDYQQQQNHHQQQLSKESSQSRIERLLTEWLQSEDYQRLLNQAVLHPQQGGVSVTALRHRAPFMRQFWYLLNRASKNAIRNKMIVLVRLFQSVFIGVIIGLVYLNINARSAIAQIQDRAGVLFFFAIYAFFSSSNSVLAIFSLEKLVFYREYRAGYYSLPAYYLTKVLVEIPYEVIFPYLMVLIPYYMIGLNPAFSAYLLAGLYVSLTALCGTVLNIYICIYTYTYFID